ncbi:MAG: polysaccharide deacetylase family protein [Candidatus Magasanikbacteria bacterium]|nr:polysaccharide deacetylase family protein [Candidatus Magasanikbacteria bacterium]
MSGCRKIFVILSFFLILPQRALAANSNTASTSSASTVYLTFDADMTPLMQKKLKQGKVKEWYDPELISYLEKERVPATIFVTGMFAEIYPSVVKRWADSGLFIVGNHSYSHPGFTAHCYGLTTVTSTAAKQDQIEKTQKILTPLIGYTPTYFRYPGLCHTAADDQLVASLGLKIAPATIISGDAFAKNSSAIVKNVLKQLKDNAVILMHTGGPNAPATTAAVKTLVPILEKRGFLFKTLP